MVQFGLFASGRFVIIFTLTNYEQNRLILIPILGYDLAATPVYSQKPKLLLQIVIIGFHTFLIKCFNEGKFEIDS